MYYYSEFVFVQLYFIIAMFLGNPDNIESNIESSPYLQDILAYERILSSHENKLLRLFLSEFWGL